MKATRYAKPTGCPRHPFYVAADGVNRPVGPDKHAFYGQGAADGSGVVPVERVVNGESSRAMLVCRYEDVKEVFRRQDVFSRAHAAAADDVDLSGTMLAMDGQEHARVRGVVKDAFSVSAVSAARSKVERLAASQLGLMTDGRSGADLLADFALPLSLHTICDMLGLPEHDRMRWQAWGDMFLATADVTREQAAGSAREMGAYLWEQLELRRECPRVDLLSRIATLGADLPADVQVKLPLALVVGGWETTASSIATFVFVLLSRPYRDHVCGWQYLLEHSEKLESAITELERLYSTAAGDDMPRKVMRDVELPSGARLAKGDIVIPSHDAANRDPRVFHSPSTMDFDRDPNLHLSFGYGPHYCVGAHLGALEVRTAIRSLMRELPELCLAVPPADVRWKAGHAVAGPVQLPVRW